MKTIIKCFFFLLTTSVSAQNQLLEELPTMLQNKFGIKMQKSINLERDIQREGRPLKSRADIYTFVLDKEQREKIFPGLLESFEKAGQQDPNCYGINSMNELMSSLRNLIIGDNLEHYVTIGQDYSNYINVNFIDAKDTTKTHRFAYALEWREMQGTTQKGSLEARFIITYAKIPMQQPSITYNASIKQSDLTGHIFTSEDEDMYLGDILLLFAQLRQKYESGQNKPFNAFSIYSLCKRARNNGYFQNKGTKEELELLIDEVATLYNKETNPSLNHFLKLALEELAKIKDNK